jgi:hypothetical protein
MAARISAPNGVPTPTIADHHAIAEMVAEDAEMDAADAEDAEEMVANAAQARYLAAGADNRAVAEALSHRPPVATFAIADIAEVVDERHGGSTARPSGRRPRIATPHPLHRPRSVRARAGPAPSDVPVSAAVPEAAPVNSGTPSVSMLQEMSSPRDGFTVAQFDNHKKWLGVGCAAPPTHRPTARTPNCPSSLACHRWYRSGFDFLVEALQAKPSKVYQALIHCDGDTSVATQSLYDNNFCKNTLKAPP